eukprot:1818147-Alexandrium_andersonii.AAC.1
MTLRLGAGPLGRDAPSHSVRGRSGPPAGPRAMVPCWAAASRTWGGATCHGYGCESPPSRRCPGTWTFWAGSPRPPRPLPCRPLSGACRGARVSRGREARRRAAWGTTLADGESA